VVANANAAAEYNACCTGLLATGIQRLLFAVTLNLQDGPGCVPPYQRLTLRGFTHGSRIATHVTRVCLLQQLMTWHRESRHSPWQCWAGLVLMGRTA